MSDNNNVAVAEAEAALDACEKDECCSSAMMDKLKEARAKMSAVLNDLNAKASEVGAAVKKNAQCAQEKAREGIEKTEKTIQAHPLAAVGIALGIGVLIGLCIPRRRD
tara:strand:+ start:311 stop:634 length:324 start_codon:yes stop_codon:yes gene_type:complete